MSVTLIAIAAFVAVAALVGGVALAFRPDPSSKVEDRLQMLTAANTPGGKDSLKQRSLLTESIENGPGAIELLFNRITRVNFDLLFEQADTSMTVTQLVVISLGLGAGGACVPLFFGLHPVIIPISGLCMAMLPLGWLAFRRKRRLKAFSVQLPDALEMLSRALRAGQSLQAGFNLVGHEVVPPLGKEFGRVFEEQNLGVTLEEALDNLTERVPNLDLKFFATAVVLQRQTGGDLAEILDKIGSLVRQRFQIWGQVQALTGEGRLSGIVLMALPVLLFLTVYWLNPDYVMLLFTEPMGKKMLIGAIVLQVLGAICIRKIVNIKV